MWMRYADVANGPTLDSIYVRVFHNSNIVQIARAIPANCIQTTGESNQCNCEGCALIKFWFFVFANGQFLFHISNYG